MKLISCLLAGAIFVGVASADPELLKFPNVVPLTDSAFSLGTDNLRWKEIWVDTIKGASATGYEIIPGSQFTSDAGEFVFPYLWVLPRGVGSAPAMDTLWRPVPAGFSPGNPMSVRIAWEKYSGSGTSDNITVGVRVCFVVGGVVGSWQTKGYQTFSWTVSGPQLTNFFEIGCPSGTVPSFYKLRVYRATGEWDGSISVPYVEVKSPFILSE